jgi:Rod binding domain-containing protein
VNGISSFGSNAGVVLEPLTTNADKFLHQTPSLDKENAKIEKSAKDFESILLGSWLQQTEQSFGSLPGAEDDDADSGKDQYAGIAMQALGTSMTAAGGIGIARMVSKSLHRAEDARVAHAAKIPAVHTE